MRYKKGDKVRVGYCDEVLTIAEYFEGNDYYHAVDDNGVDWCPIHHELLEHIEHIKPKSRKRKPVELWYRMVGE